MPEQIEDFLGEFRLGRGPTAPQVAAKGLAILLGLAFITAGPILARVGVIGPLAFVLAGFALALTLLNALELLGGSSERGGSYTLVQETSGGMVGFLTGWCITAGSLTVSAALALATAAHLALLFPQIDARMIPLTALTLASLLLLAQLLQVFAQRRLTLPLVTLFIAGLLAITLADLPAVQLEMYRTAERGRFSDLVQAVALLSAGYIAFEAVLMSRTWVANSERRKQRATLIALTFSSGLFALVSFVAIGLATPDAALTALAQVLGRGRLLPASLSLTLGFGATALALNGSLNTTARQLHAMSRHGALPAALRHVYRPFRSPSLLFVTIAIALLPLTVWGDPHTLINVAALAFLFAMTTLDAVAIYSHQVEPDRRRPFMLPFFPLVPGLAIAVNIALALAVPFHAWLWLGGWLLAGGAVYLLYARFQQVKAQEGVLVFGRQAREGEREARYRILVPISPQEDRRLLLRLATVLARQTAGEVIPLQVIPIADPLAMEEGRRLARERNTLFRWSTQLGADAGVPTRPITRLARRVPDGIIDTATEEQCNLILLAWGEVSEDRSVRLGHVLDPVVRNAPCDVAVVAYQRANAEPLVHVSRILVPTAGGPHAPLAMRLAVWLANQYGATITALYVVDPDATSEEVETGRQRIQETLIAAREEARALAGQDDHAPPEDVIIEPRIVSADDVVAGIVNAAADHDLVLLGASEQSIIDQVIFGNVPERIARACPMPVLMVKHYRGLPHLWAQHTWDALYGALPTLSLEEQIEVYKQVRRGARPDIDFFVMMGLATIIATLGLLLNSTAVIIGAMLVAPLMTPVLALSISIIMGDTRLLRLAIESTLKGVVLAIMLAAILVATSPLKTITPEVQARVHPNLFDLGVALASGAAGAYALARKDVSAALPGVAVAAALVPPLGVIGVGLAMGDLGIAGGGMLLFTTNLIAITLAGALIWLLLGFRPGHTEERETRLRVGLSTVFLLLAIITMPLAAVFVQSARTSRVQQTIRNTLEQEIRSLPGTSLVDVSFEEAGQELQVTATVYVQRRIRPAVVRSIGDALSRAVNKPVRLRFVTILTSEIEAPP